MYLNRQQHKARLVFLFQKLMLAFLSVHRFRCLAMRKLTSVSFIGMAWLVCHSGFATEAEDDLEASNPMEEIVVTGNLLNTTVDETRYSLSIFQDDDVRRQTDRDLNELLGRLPNVEVDPLEGLVIRGLSTKGIGGDLGTQLYLIDGAWSPGIFHKWDMDQLEVLRGSQSTFGSAASGTLALKYKEPEFETSGNLMVSFEGEANDREAGIAFGGPLIEDQLSYRLAAYNRASDGLMANQFIGTKRWQRLEEDFARAKLNWYPQGQGGDEYAFEFYYLNQDSGGSGWVNQGSLPDEAYSRKTSIERETFDNVELVDIRFRFKRQISAGTLINVIASANLNKSHELEDRNNQPSDDGFIERQNDNRNFALTAHLRHDAKNWQWSAAFYSFYFDTKNTTDFVIPLGFLPADPVDWKIRYILNNEKWWITGGRLLGQYYGSDWYLSASISFDDDRADTVRATEHSRISSSGIPGFDAVYDGFIAGAPAVEKKDKYHATRVNPAFAFGYYVSPATTVGIKLEQASRRGWDRINAFRAQIYSYDPETARDLDVFLRTSLFDNRMQLNANLFTGYIKDQQIDYCFSAALFDCHIVNAIRTERKGIEVDSWLFLGNAKIWIAASFLDAEFDEFTPPELEDQGLLVTNPDEELEFTALESVDVPNSPSWKASIGAIYEKGSFFSSLDLTVRPGTLGSVSVAEVSNDRRTLLNGRIGWRFSNGVELSLWGRNLADEEYLTYFSPTEPGAFVGDPRQIGVTLEYDWGY